MRRQQISFSVSDLQPMPLRIWKFADFKIVFPMRAFSPSVFHLKTRNGEKSKKWEKGNLWLVSLSFSHNSPPTWCQTSCFLGWADQTLSNTGKMMMATITKQWDVNDKQKSVFFSGALKCVVVDSFQMRLCRFFPSKPPSYPNLFRLPAALLVRPDSDEDFYILIFLYFHI